MIELNELRKAIKSMTRQQSIYRLLRDELTLQGYWKKKKRGKPNQNFNKNGNWNA
jgi:hypothetical protein